MIHIITLIALYYMSKTLTEVYKNEKKEKEKS